MAKERYRVLAVLREGENEDLDERDLHLIEDVFHQEFEFDGRVKDAITFAGGILFESQWRIETTVWRVDISDEGRWRPLTEEEILGKAR